MNQLQFESSPYLLQHANNPVDWFAWKPEAFQKAREEDKPIIVSIGYSTCHWCHVMERESFENEQVASFMNEHFVNIKVDREERPDVDQIYMEACQAISGSGGWPLNCFLMPDGRPFFAGTYYPPRPAHNRPSWIQLLQNMKRAFTERRSAVEDQANRLTQIVENADNVFITDTLNTNTEQQAITSEDIAQIYHQMQSRFDRQEGGFGGAPKFPGSMSLQFLLEYYFQNQQEEALKHLELSLDKMILGGIYDQLGGGFARYATDRAWLVPHFEKMLYDNALLVGLLSAAYQSTGKSLYKETIEETLDFIEGEMTNPEGGFYAALDADSEGVEGKFYIWSWQELQEVLGEDLAIFAEYYGASPDGNWEGNNILWRPNQKEVSIAAKGLDEKTWNAKLSTWKQKLLDKRANRIRPGLDDKILLGWNALMITAYAQAYKALGHKAYKDTAEQNLNFLLTRFLQDDGLSLYHTYKDGRGQYKAVLTDYAFLIEALLNVYEISFQPRWLEQANSYIQLVIDQFFDEKSSFFFFTSETQTDILMRKKDMYDSAIPSGNSTMAMNLRRLGIIKDRQIYNQMALAMYQKAKEAILKYPTSFSRWARGLMQVAYPLHEVAIVGPAALEQASAINQRYFPNKIIMAAAEENNSYPLLADRRADGGTNIFICKEYSCQLPVKTLQEVEELIIPRHNS